jgi:hypothetical protein
MVTPVMQHTIPALTRRRRRCPGAHFGSVLLEPRARYPPLSIHMLPQPNHRRLTLQLFFQCIIVTFCSSLGGRRRGRRHRCFESSREIGPAC